MVALRTCMNARYADWIEDFPQETGWSNFFEDCPGPNFEAIPENHEIDNGTPIWPGRRGESLQGAPEGAHVGRAFNRIEPDAVRVVVLGQDPYPDIAQATGRAFEDGRWSTEDRPQDLASSLKPLMLAAWATQQNHSGAFRSGGWPEIVLRRDFALPDPGTHFDALAEQGVLFVNVAWTRTGSSHLAAHRSFWEPVLGYMLGKLARCNQPVVFLLLGEDARDAFCSADPVCNRSAIVYNAHPGRGGFYSRNNPLVRVNQALGTLDAPQSIDWWPHQQAHPGE